MSDFFLQGGYGAYVWPAYLLSALALVGLTAWALTDWRRAKAELQRLDRSARPTP